MKRYFCGCLAVFLILGLHLKASAVEILMDLNRAADWQPTHDVSSFKETAEGFLFRCLDADPYIVSKAVDFSAAQYSAIVFQMEVEAGSQLQIFWARRDDPTFTEGKSHKLPLIVDGELHTYAMILSDHSEWTGEIVRLRLDPSDARARVHLQSFQIIDRIGPIIAPVFFHPDTPCAEAGKTMQLNARFRNEGDQSGSVKIRLEGLPKNIKVIDQTGETLTISQGEEADASWTLLADGECAEAAACVWAPVEESPYNSGGGRMQTVVQAAQINPPVEAGILESGDYRLTFCRTELGYGPIVFSVKKSGQFEPVALMPRLGTVHVRHNDGSTGVYPIFHRKSGLNPTPEKRHPLQNDPFTVEWRDKDGRLWIFTLHIQKQNGLEGAFRFLYELESDGGRLLHFSGPEFYLGEGSFGRAKDMAVFPGIEYLDQDAVSSSDEVAHPPVRDQYAPHPYKNTIPFMSLVHDEVMASLLWPANMEWAGGRHGLSPVFAVPNRWQGQDNHFFSLFVPNVPDFTMENSDTAFDPYIMKSGDPARIDCTLYFAASRDPNDALEAWLKLYGGGRLPDPMPAPRTYGEEIQLSRQAYLYSCWSEEAQGWGHCVGWNAYPSGGMLALLDIDAFLNPGGEDQTLVQERVESVYEHILNRSGPAGLGSSSGCHVMNFEPSFYWGVTESTLPGWIQRAEGMSRSQNSDGSWGFHPTSPERATLGDEGEVVSGTISPNAMYLMRLARISADPTATEAGLKALNAFNQRTVPRGAQGWECPIAAADILVSGHGARANLDAYRITGNPQYLERAVYWARSGIIFHYLWNLEERPLQRYACIPIFGTTFFSHSWLGVPVQWCGLVYSYALQELAEFDDSQPWRTIAEGIVNSAMIQQVVSGKNIGTLPDSYGDYFLTARGAWINPENIMTNLHALEGNSLNIQTVFPGRRGDDALRISANAALSEAAQEDGALRFSIESKKRRITEILIAPVERIPRGVWIEPNTALPREDSLFEKSAGWKHLSRQKALLIHVQHEEERMPLRVEMQ